MNKSFLALVSGALLIAAPAFASQEPIKGKSSLKLSESTAENSARDTRKSIDAIDKEIVSLDSEITQMKMQAVTLRSIPARGTFEASQLEMVATAKEMQKSRLQAERVNLQSSLQAE